MSAPRTSGELCSPSLHELRLVAGWLLHKQMLDGVWGTRYLSGLNTCEREGQEAGLGRGSGSVGRPSGVLWHLSQKCPVSGPSGQTFIALLHSFSQSVLRCGWLQEGYGFRQGGTHDSPPLDPADSLQGPSGSLSPAAAKPPGS